MPKTHTTETRSEPISRCGACGQDDNHPKHQVLVGFNNPNTKGEFFHPDDVNRDGVIEYHFDCPTEWHDLHSKLNTVPVKYSEIAGPNGEEPSSDPADDWTQEQANEHKAIADTHRAIVEKALSGTQGEELRRWIVRLHARGGAGGIDQTRANEFLNALSPNSGTKTVGAQTITGPIKMRLMTAQGSDSAAGTELATSGGYTAGGASVSMGTASAGSVASNGAVSWTNMPSTTLTGMEQWDSSATALRTFWAPWSAGNIVVASSNTFTVASGSLTDALA